MLKQTLLTVALFVGWPAHISANEGKELIQKNCLGCHTPTAEGLSRISYQRKTPEGWEMTINRMQTIHGLKISNQLITTSTSQMHQMVKYLADTQGLAPPETEGVRYLLERDLNRVENFEPLIAETCGRCHTSARVALQRRNEKEWNYLVDFHLGQWPSVEYSLYGRDRPWLKLSREKIVPKLASNYSLESKAWSDWLQTDKPTLQGSWIFSGHMPSKGFFSATMNASETKKDYYSLVVNGSYQNGERFTGSGESVVYTGFEWRGNINFGDIKLRQVFAANTDGTAMTGRFYQKGQELMGMNVNAIKDSNTAQILSVTPNSIRKGEESTLTITGTGLSGTPTINGLQVNGIVSQTPNQITLKVTATEKSDNGYTNINVGDAILEKQLAIYDKVETLEVYPSYGISRIGGNGGSRPKLNTIFRAIGKTNGSDGKAGTEDDLNLGYMDNVIWEAIPRDEVASQDEDVKFSGKMDSKTGVYQPSNAGPNPERKRSTNNAGNLNVRATLMQEDNEISAIGRLLVTVQVWVDPPLK